MKAVAVIATIISLVNSQVFTGKYADPNHPKCARFVTAETDKSAEVFGFDALGGEGAACDSKSDTRWGPLPAEIQGNKILVDFSSKGGPKALSGVYDITTNSIKWEDGNAWPREYPGVRRFTGKYSDPNHPSCARSISLETAVSAKVFGADAAAGEGAACDGRTDVKWGPLPATINSTTISVDFSSKGGPSGLIGEYNDEKAVITWADGNAWPKIKEQLASSPFPGSYSDPNHPSCARTIKSVSSVAAQVFGADAAGGEGAACDGRTDIAWGPLPAAVDGSNIQVDFSSKGGPPGLKGVFDYKKNGINWSDGNSWPKL